MKAVMKAQRASFAVQYPEKEYFLLSLMYELKKTLYCTRSAVQLFIVL